MAGSNSDEEENYWPGYVDALTTMTMVLTFIMMVLGVMVFILSQDSVSSKLGLLARALKIDARQLEKLSQQDIEEALRKAASANELGPRSTQTEQGSEAGGEQVAHGGTGTSASGQPGAAGLTKDIGSEGTLRSTFTGGLIGDKNAGPGGEYLVTETVTGVAGPERGYGGRIEPGPGALRFVFERGAIDMPSAVSDALEAYVAAEGKGPMLVEAKAVANEGGPTEARRKAYFRAMLIRSRLIKLGMDPRRISVLIIDSAQVTALETVDVMKRPAGAAPRNPG